MRAQTYGGACYCGVPLLKEAGTGGLDQRASWIGLSTKLPCLTGNSQRLLDWSDDYDLDALFERLKIPRPPGG